MTTLRQLREVLIEVARLFSRDPLGMMSVALRRVFNGMDDAQHRLKRVQLAHPALIPQATRDETGQHGEAADSNGSDSAAQEGNS